MGFDAIATPEQVAAQILFLASDDAATVNGTFLLADWGGTARSTWPI